MTTRSILLAVTEPQMLVDINQALGPAWQATSVATEADALAQFEKGSFDAVLVDFNLGSPDASELLNKALEKHPQTNRFLFAYEADLALVAAKVNGTPHILPKPLEPTSLKNRIESGVRDANSKQNGNSANRSEPANNGNAPEEAPKIPAIYAEVLKAFESPEVTNQQVGEIIAKDTALTSEIFRIANPSYLGIPRNVARPVEAVEMLGLEAVKGIVMALQFLAEHRRLKPGYLSLDDLWQHSINVGQVARDLVLLETKDNTLASQALLAGLLHDLGKAVLAKNFEDMYGRVHSLARKQPVALCDVEKEMFGASHGEIGGCLVGMWNLPLAIVEAVALHHEPPLGEHQQLTPLAAVHIANVLERELASGDDGMMVTPIIHTPFLNQLGLLERLPVWRAALANSKSESVDVESEGKPARKDKPAWAAHPRATQPRNLDEASLFFPGRSRIGWVWAGAAAIAVLVILWFKTQQDISEIKQAYARTPTPATQTPASAAATVSATPAPQTVTPVAVTPQATPPPASETTQPFALPLPYETAAVPQPATTPVPAVAPAAPAPTNVQPIIVSAPPVKKPDFRLQGIIFIRDHSSAIVNNQTVNPGDRVDGATVLSITRTTVTLEIKGERRVFTLGK